MQGSLGRRRHRGLDQGRRRVGRADLSQRRRNPRIGLAEKSRQTRHGLLIPAHPQRVDGAQQRHSAQVLHGPAERRRRGLAGNRFEREPGDLRRFLVGQQSGQERHFRIAADRDQLLADEAPYGGRSLRLRQDRGQSFGQLRPAGRIGAHHRELDDVQGAVVLAEVVGPELRDGLVDGRALLRLRRAGTADRDHGGGDQPGKARPEQPGVSAVKSCGKRSHGVDPIRESRGCASGGATCGWPRRCPRNARRSSPK